MTPKTKETTVLTSAPPIQNGFSLISIEKLLQLYVTTLKCRMIQERIRILFKQNKLIGHSLVAQNAPWGQEAAVVGVTIDLLPEDTIFPHPGDLIPFFVKDLQLKTLFRALFNPFAPPSSTAAQLKIATDTAMIDKLTSNNKIAVALSSKSTSLGPWQKALRFAGLRNLPMIFLSWNHIPLKTKAHGLPAITVDGNDVVAVYRVACEAIAHARMGSGPTLIECQTDSQNPVDPILNMEKYLIRKGIFSEEFKREQAVSFSKELDAAISFSQAAPCPSRGERATRRRFRPAQPE
jgi:pyruvate dehydrogenase E1 component alpha subunit